MAATLTNVNSKPYDYKTAGASGIYAASSSVEQTASSGSIVAEVFNTNDCVLAKSTGGVTATYGLTFVYYYDFATDGGAVGNVTLRGAPLPVGFRVVNAIWEPTTAFTSGGSAQISLGTSSGAATNLLGAAVLGTNGTTGPKQGVPDWATVADSVKVSVESQPVLAVSVAALTAGAGVLVLQGYCSVADAIA